MALLDALPPGGPPALAWSSLCRDALVLGRAPRDPAVDWRRCAAEGVSVHRRASGGGAVLWDAGLLALDIALPAGHPLAPADVIEAYRWLGEAVAAGLADLGAPLARVVSPADARRARPGAPDAACFGGVSPYEVLLDGRKIVGLSQIRRRPGALIQAGILMRRDPGRLAALMGRDGDFARRLGEVTTSLADLAPRVAAADVVAAIEARVAERARAELRADLLSAAEAESAERGAAGPHAALQEPRAAEGTGTAEPE